MNKPKKHRKEGLKTSPNSDKDTPDLLKKIMSSKTAITATVLAAIIGIGVILKDRWQGDLPNDTKKSVATKPDTATPEDSTSPKIGVVVTPEAEYQTIPDYTIVHDVKFNGIPGGIKISPAEFQTFSRQLAELTEKVLMEYQHDPKMFSGMIITYLNLYPNPEIKKDFAAMTAGTNDRLDLMIDVFNRYLIPGKRYIHLEVDINSKITLNLFHITGVDKVTLQGNSKGFPMIKVSYPFLANTTNEKGRYPGITVNSGNHSVIFPDNISVEEFLSRLPKDHPLKTTDIKSLQQEYVEESEHHEAVHQAIIEKYSQITTKDSLEVREFYIPLTMQAGGRTFDFSGWYNQYTIHELIAVGAELSKSKMEVPAGHMNYLIPSDNAYKLVNLILPIATLKTAQDSARKASLIETMEKRGTAETSSFDALICDPAYGPEQRREAGQILYNLGIQLAEAASSGKLNARPLNSQPR